MFYKGYLESVERARKEQENLRHRFFAQHPSLAGRGKIEDSIEDSKGKGIITEIRYVSIEPKQYYSRILILERRMRLLENLEERVKGIEKYITLKAVSPKRKPKWT